MRYAPLICAVVAFPMLMPSLMQAQPESGLGSCPTTPHLDLRSLVTAAPSTAAPRADHYAEDLYAELARAAGGKIGFEVETLEKGKMTEIEDIELGQLLKDSRCRLSACQHGPDLIDAWLEEVAESNILSGDYQTTVQAFDAINFPHTIGWFRRLKITATFGENIGSHEALELCWPKVTHCVVMDPAIPQLEAVVQNRLRLAGTSWRPEIKVRRAERSKDGAAQAGCRVAGHPSWVGLGIRWPEWDSEYRDVLTNTVMRNHLGAQEINVECRGASASTCTAQITATGGPSWCRARAPISCACQSTASAMADGSDLAIAETRCSAWASEEDPDSIDDSIPKGAAELNGGSLKIGCQWTTLDEGSLGTLQ